MGLCLPLFQASHSLVQAYTSLTLFALIAQSELVFTGLQLLSTIETHTQNKVFLSEVDNSFTVLSIDALLDGHQNHDGQYVEYNVETCPASLAI